MAQLGRMKRVTDLRSVWPHEAHDFTKWLAEEENLKELSDSIGIDIDLEERESSVGNFNVDIFATESGTGRKIIIENQLEDTNHDHLGKLITYASGKGAEVIIWIVKRARDEHRQAIEWLNRHTDSNVGFFLVEIELWQIDNSSLAPKFNIVEKPNDWAKTMKSIDGLNETQKFKVEFWQQFNNQLEGNPAFLKEFHLRTPQPHHWYDLSLGTSSYYISLTINTQKRNLSAGLYIPNDKALFQKMKDNSRLFEEGVGKELEFREASKACRILMYKSMNIKDSTKWPEAIDWLFETALKFKKTVIKVDQ
ncbi:MAG: DUF4268 domain-containing protein [Bacteroidaceae bacterium]|nr:DUF4268 domain-containing protein [Bacteroidaceae bacterium]